jgi:hypothetical protein
MFVVPEFENDEPGVRTHPWTITGYRDSGGAYYDFTKSPELIPQVLEDFRPYATYPAVKHFYGLLAWINGPESALETSDCSLRPPVPNEEFFPGKFRIGGRLQVHFREHARNVHASAVEWLWNMFSLYLQTHRREFNHGVIRIGRRDTRYLDLPTSQSVGHRLSLTFNAYGDSEVQAFEHLHTAFDGIWVSAKRVCEATKLTLPTFP